MAPKHDLYPQCGQGDDSRLGTTLTLIVLLMDPLACDVSIFTGTANLSCAAISKYLGSHVPEQLFSSLIQIGRVERFSMTKSCTINVPAWTLPKS